MVGSRIRKYFIPSLHCLTNKVGEANKVQCAYTVYINYIMILSVNLLLIYYFL